MEHANVMNRPSGIIFDCDGVMFESRRANLAFYNAILAEFGEAPVEETDRERAHLCHTAASPQVLSCLMGEERGALALEFATGLDYRRFIPKMQPEPGLDEVLSALAELYPLAIATNRGTSMPAILDHFGLAAHFLTVVTSYDVPRPKPYPDMLLEAARRMQLSVEQLLFIGDSELDQKAAQAAGVAFAVYRQPLDAEVRFESFGEILEFLSPA